MATNNGTGVDAAVQAVLTDDPDFLRDLVARVVQEILEAEMSAHLGAELYERTETRTGQRNGYRPRQLQTRVGTLTLLIPQDRAGTFSTQLFARDQRTEKALVLAVMEMYLEGVSTRKVRAITEALCGTAFSKSQVSRLTSMLDAARTTWRGRSLADHTYPYLVVDARYAHVREGGRVITQGVLIVSGVRDDGKRAILAVDVADTESEATYRAVFRDLKARGLTGVRLVTSDAHTGLKAAVTRHFQGASWQRCQVHTMRTQSHHRRTRTARIRRRAVQRDDMMDLQRPLSHHDLLNQQLHQRLLLAETRRRQATAHPLTKRRQVGEHFLRTGRLLPLPRVRRALTFERLPLLL
jgi:putative transposase